MKKILLLALLAFNISYGQTYLKLKQLQPAIGTGSLTGFIGTGANGIWEQQNTNQFQSSSTSVTSYTLTGVGTPSLTFIVNGQIRNPVSGVVTVLNNQTFTDHAVTHFTNTGVTYMGVKSDLTLTMQETRFTTEQRYNHLVEWVIVYNTSSPFNIIAFNHYPNTTNQIGQQLHNFMRNQGAKVLSGGQYSGIGTAGLHLQREASLVQDVGWGDLDSDNPNERSLSALTSTITFNTRISTGDYLTGQTVIDPTIYESAPGVVSTVPLPIDVTVYRLTFFNSNLTRVQIGQTLYPSIDVAIAATIAHQDAYNTEANIAANGITSTFLAIQKNCTDWTQTTRYRFFPNTASGSAGLTAFNTLNSSYLNSSQPQINITDTKGALQLQSARATNTTSIFEGLNIAGTTTYSLTGNGDVTSLSTTNSGATSNRAVYFDGNKKLTAASTTSTELNYVNGVTSAIQTQLDNKYSVMTHIASAAVNPADAQFYYFGQPNIAATNTGLNTSTNLREIGCPTTGTIVAAILTINVGNFASATTETSTLSLRNTTQSTLSTISSTISYDNANMVKVYTITGLSIPVTQGDKCMSVIGNPTWATNPTTVFWHVEYIIR